MKITVREFMTWYNTAFPYGCYHDDSIETHDEKDEWKLDPDAVYDTDEFRHAFIQDAFRILNGADSKPRPVTDSIKGWREQADRLQVTVAVPTVPKEAADEIVFFLRASGLTPHTPPFGNADYAAIFNAAVDQSPPAP